jgi:hypothetical protein
MFPLLLSQVCQKNTKTEGFILSLILNKIKTLELTNVLLPKELSAEEIKDVGERKPWG